MPKRLYDRRRFESIRRHQQQQQCLTLASCSPTINSHWKSSPFDEPANNDKLVTAVITVKIKLIGTAIT